MSTLILVVVAAVLGRLVRLATPRLLQMSDTTMPFRRPGVEAVAVLAFLVLDWRLGHAPAQLPWYLFALLLLAVGSADAYTKYIPTLVCYVGAVLGVACNFAYPDRIMDLLNQHDLASLAGLSIYKPHQVGIALALSGAVMGFVLIHFIRKVFRPMVNVEVMGSGDALLMLLIGAFIGPRAVLYSLLPACLVGIAVGTVTRLVFKQPHMAFGPALAVAGMFTLLFGPDMLRGFDAFYGFIYDLPPMVPLLFSAFLVLVLLFLLLRLRRKAAEYARIMDEDYAEIDKKMQAK